MVKWLKEVTRIMSHLLHVDNIPIKTEIVPIKRDIIPIKAKIVPINLGE